MTSFQEEDLADFGSVASIRKGAMDVGLDGRPNLVSLDVGDHYIKKGLDIISEVLKLNTESAISDIQFQTDRFVYIANADGLSKVNGIERLDGPDIVGILLALVFNRDAGIAVSRELQEREKLSLARALTARRKVDFSCEGGVAALVAHSGEHALEKGRFRVQAHFSATGLGVTCRILRENIMSLQETGLPDDIISSLVGFVQKKSGLGLITGATGSGKTTTIAALIEWVRINLNKHVVTIEDPIEYHYPDMYVTKGRGEVTSNSLITQQEVGRDVLTFQQGLEDALRKKPDIILLGEIRDAATMETCMEAAQTGHLVLSTLHTRGAVKTMSRLLEFFPSADTREALLTRISESLLFILSQGLLPPANGNKRVLCLEYLQNNDTASTSAIRKYAESANSLQELMIKPGNVQWDKYLQQHYNQRLISQDVYREYALDPSILNKSAR